MLPHNLADKPTKGKPKTALPDVLRIQAQNLRTQADALEATAAALEVAPAADDPWLTLPEMEEQYHITRQVLAAAQQRGELAPRRGPKGRVMIRRSEIEAWIESRAWTPRRTVKATAPDLDEWEAQAERELQLVQGGKR